MNIFQSIKGRFNQFLAFGIEIEFISPVRRHDIVSALRAARINVNHTGWTSRGNRRTDSWVMTTDSTVIGQTGFYGGNELVSPKLYGQEGKRQLKTVCKVLNQIGCKVNKSCGLHVHHDVTDVMLKSKEVVEKYLLNVIKLVAKFEHIIYRLVSPSRLMQVNGSYWTRPVRLVMAKLNNFVIRSNKEVSDLIKSNIKDDTYRKYMQDSSSPPSITQSTRYCGLNFHNIWTRGSVEFRYHQGSINFDKIWAWTVLTQLIITSSINRKSVSFTKVQTNEHGLFHFRKAIGFIGHKNQCHDVKTANKTICERFKAMTTGSMNLSRSRSGLYRTITRNMEEI